LTEEEVELITGHLLKFLRTKTVQHALAIPVNAPQTCLLAAIAFYITGSRSINSSPMKKSFIANLQWKIEYQLNFFSAFVKIK